jgi:hypothetical protein
MPAALAKHLPFLSPGKRRELFGSITAAAAYPLGSPVREGVIAGSSPFPFANAGPASDDRMSLSAYDEVMRHMIIAAAVFAVVPLVFAFRMPDWYLADKQAAVEIEEQNTQYHHERRRSRSRSFNQLASA